MATFRAKKNQSVTPVFPNKSERDSRLFRYVRKPRAELHRHIVGGLPHPNCLILAYATTIHKAQGSEHPAVILPITTQHYPMLQRNLLYTGLTRGKRLVVLVGQRKAVAIAVRNVSGRKRWSKLREWLRAAP
jgi:hypothetical protein